MSSISPVQGVMAVITFSTAFFLVSCTSSDVTDQNASSRYRMTSEFTGTQQVLAIQGFTAETYLVGFKPWVSPWVNPYSSEVLQREWVISDIGDNFYRITNRGLGETFSLDVVNDGVFDKLVLAPTDDVTGQRWRISTLDNGYCRFTTEFLGPEIALDITSDSTDPLLTLQATGNFSGQYWRLDQIGMGGGLDATCTGRD